MPASHIDLAHVGIRLSGQPQHSEAKQREEDSIAHTAPCLTNPNQGNGRVMPLETLVEDERVRPEANQLEKLRFAVEAGQHFLRMLDQQATSRSYRDLFKSTYPFTPLTSDERKLLDAESLVFIDLVASRVPDGRKLYAQMDAFGGAFACNVGRWSKSHPA
jgi:hypothetical protein